MDASYWDRLADVEKLVDKHSEHIEALDRATKANVSSIEETQKIMREIALNTSDLVSLFRGWQAFRRIITWLTPFGVAAAMFWDKIWPPK